MFRICLPAMLGLAIVEPVASVHAAPYEIVAVYTGKNADQTERKIEVKVTNGTILPNRANGLDLDTVAVRFDRTGLGSITPGTFRNFAVATSYRDVTTAVSVPSAELNPSASRTLVKWRDVHDPARTTYFDVTIHGKFSPSFLCSQELYLREITGQRNACNGTTKQPGCAKDGYFEKPATRPDRSLFVDGAEVLFTFCGADDPDESGSVKWDLVQKDGGLGRTDTGAKLKALHKQRLHQLLMQKNVLTKFVNQYADLKSGPDAAGLPNNLFVEEDVKFSVRLVGELFVLAESDNRTPRPVGEVVDQRSTLVISADGRGVGDCPNLAEFKYVFAFTGDGDKATVDELSPRFLDGCKSVLNVDLTKYLDKRVTVRVIQKTNATQELVLVETQFTVASLGFQWTIPIVSEVITALNATSPRDLTASSSLPLGIAIGRNRSRLALSFPFRASWNTRSFTNLSRYFALFGHLTVLADPDGDSNTELAVGAGVAAFQFFHFGWAISLGANHRNYLLLSIDIRDVSKFIISGNGN
jgi:hypothetical protein